MYPKVSYKATVRQMAVETTSKLFSTAFIWSRMTSYLRMEPLWISYMPTLLMGAKTLKVFFSFIYIFLF